MSQQKSNSCQTLARLRDERSGAIDVKHDSDVTEVYSIV